MVDTLFPGRVLGLRFDLLGGILDRRRELSQRGHTPQIVPTSLPMTPERVTPTCVFLLGHYFFTNRTFLGLP